MTIRAGFFSETIHQTATDVSQDFQIDTTVADKRFSYLVTSDTDINLFRTEGNAESATAATTTNGMRIPAATPVLVNAFASDWFSFVKGSGEDDGNVWFTRTDH